jgi:hypothetical protein
MMRHELRRVRAVEDAARRALLGSLTSAELQAITDPDERWRKGRHPNARGLKDLSVDELETLAAGGRVDGFAHGVSIDEAALRRDAAGAVYDAGTGALIASAEEWRLRERVLKRLNGADRALMGPPAAHDTQD